MRSAPPKQIIEHHRDVGCRVLALLFDSLLGYPRRILLKPRLSASAVQDPDPGKAFPEFSIIENLAYGMHDGVGLASKSTCANVGIPTVSELNGREAPTAILLKPVRSSRQTSAPAYHHAIHG
jgi:hypothetical protein